MVIMLLPILIPITIIHNCWFIITVIANTPSNGNLSKVPYCDINYTMEFKVKGTPLLPKDEIKKKIC